MGNKKKPIAVWILIWLEALLGFGAVVSGVMLMISPDGSLMQLPLYLIKSSPFMNFFIPGLILCLLLGVYPMGIAYGLWKLPAWRWPDVMNPFRKLHWSWAGSLAAGIIVIIWLSVELLWTPPGFLHILYYVWSVCILIFTLIPATLRYCRKK